ncbi:MULTISPECIES: NAD(P)-binding domain-containing protein [Kitasatospora]|uniref:Putative oxidoreductase n=1 Tax=Kitasatospora setae (strain ATCC 33774 / DSM 43861 / JCM 3304 / KCC A-0304 / NBRC 14216 / KM-6054) TaxID=452652 RepID=E4N0W7_KITSK|nr:MULTISPECIES: NAD(P)-binding domain-containing protein [Kitasatospora]BAJ31801.1 putative oxidoreductase [Kitasatospora setae KM-6054]
MQINVLGTGNVGSVLARRLADLGHTVTTANTSTPAEKSARQAAEAELTVLAVPFGAVAELPAEIRAALADRIVIDATNPLAADYLSLTVGHTTSGGEQVAAALPGAKVVKAFNTAMAVTMETGTLSGTPLLLPVAGDDRAAVATVVALGGALGFDALDAGPLTNARYLEPAVELLIQLAFAQGHGANIGFALARG